ncbi:MAG TPA: ATP-binding protein, partial [Alphaproteobacteria bacterium]|nr:ATP-binding protein [Alphaproteobacteria bacterium]
MAEENAAPEGAGKMSSPAWTVWAHRALWVVVAALLISAYLSLSGPGGPLPRPAVLDRLLAAIGLGPWGVSRAAGALALILAFLAAAGALSICARGDWERGLIEALETEPAPRALTAPGGGALWWNEAFARIASAEGEEVLAALEKRLEGEGAAKRFARLRETAEAGGGADSVFRVADPSGPSRWVKIQVRAVKPSPGRVLWCAEDITARRRMEFEAEEERNRLLDFMDDAQVAMYVADAGGVIEFVNKPFADLLGLSAAELTDGEHRLADLVGGEGADPGRPYAPFALGVSGNRGEAVFKRKDGEEVEAEVIQRVLGEAGTPRLKAQAIVRDLAAERAFEGKLANAEDRFKRLFEEAPLGIAILDPDFVIAENNTAFRGTAAKGVDVTGSALADLVTDEDREALAAWLAPLAHGEEPPSVLDVHLAESEDGEGALHGTPLLDADGEPAGAIIHLLDITQHRRLEAQFTQSQKLQAVGQLAGGIAHDFNNLLTVMIGFCDLVLQRYRPGEQTFADIMQIKQNANRAANLVRQLLAFSRQQTLQPTVINITDVLAELSNLLGRLIGVNIALDVVHGRDLALVKVDQVQLEQVIINLAVNARDAMKDQGGTLTIKTANEEIEGPVKLGSDVMPPGNYVSITITDTGHGIAREHLSRIFDPFFSTKEVGAGTGLGLSTVYGIVTQTGGYVSVDSTEGEGTEFVIYLPAYEATEEEAAAAQAEEGMDGVAPARDTSGVGTVLLVEDEDPVRLFGARALRNKGYQVLEAKNGGSAIQVLEDSEEHIDLVISDVVMPELDGPGLVREVRKRYPTMKVIFMSGYAEDE